jgi:hypothetical protein
MPTIVMPEAGVTGLPEGTKEQGQRVDFRPDQFDLAIETKGYRLAWSRAAQCPCMPINAQTEQPDPNCPICKGSGWLHFRPNKEPLGESVVGQLSDVQRSILEKNQAVVIRGIMSGISTKSQPFDPIGSRLEGTLMLTVRHQNKLGYYDRIVNLDSVIVYSEILETGMPTEPLATRYPIVGINLLRSVNTELDGADFKLESGRIVWLAGRAPAPGTRLVCHYLTHPTWLVVEHPHAIRSSPVKFKTQELETPRGKTRPLPVQAVVKFEFMS